MEDDNLCLASKCLLAQELIDDETVAADCPDYQPTEGIKTA